MNEVIKGTEFVSTTIVTENNTAFTVGSGEAEVFSTPMMVALMENSAYLCLKPYLDEDETSVGIKMDTTHESASPIGLAITARATITEVNGKIITFEVIASDAFGIIGRGMHQRAVVNTEKFVSRANAKLASVE
ncbi:MAG: thioesterase family protein [Oscillospiraceae bacterium]|nr:thioesterase family protein [Oscillospiraceae bacterium]